MSELLEAALTYARLGWPVLPLYTWRDGACSCGAPDCHSPAKHPLRLLVPNGVKNASTDVDIVAEWWERYPTANIGLRTGVAFDVLDVDGEEGRASMRAAIDQFGGWAVGPATETGGGGAHVLFRPTAGGNRAAIFTKVDWRGQNGYIVAPPSVHASGRGYTWKRPPSLAVPAVPRWLATIVNPPRIERGAAVAKPLPAGINDGTEYGLRALEAELEELARAPEGTRNHALNECAFNLYQLVAGGELHESAVEERVRLTAQSIGLSDREVDQTLSSGRKAGLESPRSAPELHVVTSLRNEPDANEQKPDLDLDEFLEDEGPEHDWLVEGLLERGDRMILTGPEGGGKSTLLRQIAVQCGAGVHPFTLEPIPPIRVMLLDLENSTRHVRRKLKPLRQLAKELQRGKVRVRVEAAGIDLLHPIWQEWLELRMQANEPELLVVGPLYKLAGGDPVEEKTARTVALFLDGVRKRHGVTILIEAHAPHQVAGKRPERPYGASLWLRWPEFGLWLDSDGHIRHWRGARDERSWPTLLGKGAQEHGAWPWVAITDDRAVKWAEVVRVAKECIARTGSAPTERELEELTGYPKTTIHRQLKNNEKEWNALKATAREEPAE